MRVLLSLFVSVICFSSSLVAAEDLLLGIVSSSDNKSFTAKFNAKTTLLPDNMVAIFGNGKITKHPMTGDVVKEERKVVAKAQVLSVSDKTISGRITWLLEGSTISKGFDVVPLPNEATPDAPPILRKKVRFTVIAQQTVPISLDIVDPENKPLSFKWELKGEAGKTGVLASTYTGEPKVIWTAPGQETSCKLVCTATDANQQTMVAEVDLSVKKLGSSWKSRRLRPFIDLGQENKAKHLHYSVTGKWWSVSKNNEITPMTNNFNLLKRKTVSIKETELRSPIAVDSTGKNLVILGKKAVFVFKSSGRFLSSFEGMSSPTDLAVAKDGTIYVADQSSGGVLVFESNGSFRATLGRAGSEGDGFARLKSIALDADDNLYALDAGRKILQRFDKNHRRMKTWIVPGNSSDDIVDITVRENSSGKNILVLSKTGSVFVFDMAGKVISTLKSPESLMDKVDYAESIETDGSGNIFVTYSAYGVIARYTDNKLYGVKSDSLWNYYKLVRFDAQGNSYGLDKYGKIYKHDSEGWRVAFVGGIKRYGGKLDNVPHDFAVSPDGKILSFIDQRKYAIGIIDLSKNNSTPAWVGQRGKNNGQFERPNCIAIDEANMIYVSDEKTHAVSVFDSSATFLFRFGRYNRGREPYEIEDPKFMAVSPSGNAVYIYDSDKYEYMKFSVDHKSKTGKHVTNGGGKGKEHGRVSRPIGMSCDRQGLLYLLDSGRKDMQVMDFKGNSPVFVYSLDYTSNVSSPSGLSMNPDGLVFIIQRGKPIGFRWQ